MRRERYLFTSQPMKIGKKEWRLVIYPANGYLGCSAFTDYEFRAPAWKNLPAEEWNRSEDWPRYNNHASDNGLPRTLRALYERHKEDVAYYCHGVPYPDRCRCVSMDPGGDCAYCQRTQEAYATYS